MQHSGKKFHGEIESPHKRLTAFSSVVYGVRAMVKILRTYRRKGYVSYRSIITRYAPPSENDTDAYIKYVCKKCGAIPTDMVSEALEYNLIAAICWYESSFKLTPELWEKVMKML